jgi:hypothetical protein
MQVRLRWPECKMVFLPFLMRTLYRKIELLALQHPGPKFSIVTLESISSQGRTEGTHLV